MTQPKKRYRLLNILQKTVIMLLTFLMLSAFAIPVISQAETKNKVVRVGWFESPFNITNSNGRRSGYAYEYQQRISAYTGWTYEYVEGTWPDLLQMLKNGEIDLLSDVSYTEERAEQVLFSDIPMGTQEYYLFVSKDNKEIRIDDLSTLNGRTVGVNKGSIQIEYLKDWMEFHDVTMQLIELNISVGESLKMLDDGKIDMYLTLDSYGDPDKNFAIANVGSSDFFFAVSKQRSDLLSDLNYALSKLHEDDRYYNQKLAEKYIKTKGIALNMTPEELTWLDSHGAIKVGYIDDYLAYCAKDSETGQLTGALKDYLDKISDSFINIDLNFEPRAYQTVTEALKALNSGEIDCLFPVNFSDYEAETEKVMLTSPIVNVTLYAVVRASDRQNFAETERLTVAVELEDINHSSIALDNYPDCQMVVCDDTEECLKAVSDGNADCYLISSYRYNIISRICDRYHLVALDTGKAVPSCFAVNNENTILFSMLSKATHIIPESYVNTLLSRYFSDEGKDTLLDLIKENILIVISIIVVILALILLVIIQNRLIRAQRKEKEHRLIADELGHRVYVDPLTSVRNKNGYTDCINSIKERLESGEVFDFAVCMLDCDDLKYINDKYGHDKGDEYLQTAAGLICRIFQHSPVFRIGGDEFVAVLQNEDFLNRAELLDRFVTESKTINDAAENDWKKVNISLGLADFDPQTDNSAYDTVSRADRLMYKNKRERKSGRELR